MFLLSAGKSNLAVLQKGVITSGSINVYDVKFQFDNDWDGLDRIAVFRVGKERISVALDDTNTCKLPWECVRENDIGKEVQVGVYGMVDTTVALPTIWAGIGKIKEGACLGDTAIPTTPSVAEQILAQVLAARDEVFAAILANGGTIPETETDTDTETDTGTDTGTEEETGGDDVATDEEVSDAFDDIFGA